MSEELGTTKLAELSFQYPLRRYQQEILELIKLKLAREEKQLHIVAPPGAGKTIIGLQLIAQLKVPSLVVCPTSTIQAQWGQKLSLFLSPDAASQENSELLGTHEETPLKPITVLTYQVLSTPGKEQEMLEKLAHKALVKELSSKAARSQGEAELRALELMQNNRPAYDHEIGRHISKLRLKLAEIMDLQEVLHPNALNLLQTLRRQKFKVVIFDECHHLTDYWAAVMMHVVRRLDDPLVIGLTGTPPEGKTQSQENRYLHLVGDIDYQVPTPALVKEGGLAPFQDLVYFCEPALGEEQFLLNQHEEFRVLVQELIEAEPFLLSSWVEHNISEIANNNFEGFLSDQPKLATALIRYSWALKFTLPAKVELSDFFRHAPLIDDWMILLADFALNYLKTSASSDNHKLYERIKSAMGKLGFMLTEKGLRKYASAVDRVLAFSKNKLQAAAQILDLEYKSLDDRLRAAVITDFERMSAGALRAAKGVLNEQSGGAVAVLRELLGSSVGMFINPVLVTGSLLLVDKRIVKQFLEASQSYLAELGHEFSLAIKEHEDQAFVEITAGSSQWEPRLYVGLTTHLLVRGITKCLVGTRGILGEGWDCQALNTLVDLTTATSPVSVKQLRGRSLRLDVDDPLGQRKVANNWDIVCIAPHLEKGLNDYQRFVRKHDGYFGIADDGQIECGVGHVYPAFSELTPQEVFAHLDVINTEMASRALIRDKIYDLWQVGKPYSNKTLGCVEVFGLRKLSLTPPHLSKNMTYKEHIKWQKAALNGIWWEYAGLATVASASVGYVTLSSSLSWVPAIAYVGSLTVFVISSLLAYKKYLVLYERLKQETCRPNTQESSLTDMGYAVLSALQQVKLLPAYIKKDSLKVLKRSDGSFRVFLDNVEEEQAQSFAKSFQELLEPVTNQPFLIPKYEYSFARSKTSNFKIAAAAVQEPVITSKASKIAGSKMEIALDEESFFTAYINGKATPRLASYHAVPKLLARSEKGREAFQATWNKYVSPGFVISSETKPELLNKYYGLGPSLAQRMLWE